jgi:hypothetical protein
VTRGHLWHRQIWIPFYGESAGRWHNAWKLRIGTFLYRWCPPAWRALKHRKKANLMQIPNTATARENVLKLLQCGQISRSAALDALAAIDAGATPQLPALEGSALPLGAVVADISTS